MAIVGAGLSGLTCARNLVERGFEVEVFDKGRRPGGRASTRRISLGESEVAFDHGAQYFTVRERSMERLVARWQEQGVVQPWRGRIVALEKDGDVRDSGTKTRFVGTPGMSALCNHLWRGLHVRCGVVVGSVASHSEGIELFDHQGDRLGRFDAVVSSAPPAQTSALIRDAAPDLARRVESVVMKPCWAVLAAFDVELDVPFDGAFVNHGALGWIARTSAKPQRVPTPERWVLHASSDWSTAHLEASADRVAQELLAAYFEAVGLAARDPMWLHAHRWRYALAEEPLDVGCLHDRSERIFACGDWAYGNRVEGAVRSGEIAAARVRCVFDPAT